MKYSYAYKTSDGVRHQSEMNAESREAVFASLRKQGIKAIKVVATDGSRANGEIRGVRKRVVVASAITAAIVGGVLALVSTSMPRRQLTQLNVASPLPRQEIFGDRKRILDAASSLPSKAESFLARFVEPGRSFVAPESDWPSKEDFDKVLSTPIRFANSEYTEQIDLKRMVESLKKEMRIYLSGGGYVSGYIKDLIKRQQMEIDMRNQALTELKQFPGKKAYEYWLKANAKLQSMGIYPLALPPHLLQYQSDPFK